MTKVMVVWQPSATRLGGTASEILRGVYESFGFEPRSSISGRPVFAYVNVPSGQVGGPVEQADLAASTDPINHRARRALTGQRTRVTLRDAQVKPDAIVFLFQQTDAGGPT